MKRCPHCEFIYEDDQSFCDMDGTKLDHDSRILPKLQALSSTAEPDSRWRSRAVPAFASALLAIVLGVVYFVSIRQVEPSVNAGTAPIAVETPVINSSATPALQDAETTNGATDPNSQAGGNNSRGREEAAVEAEAKKPSEARSDKHNVGRSAKPSQVRNQKEAEKDDSKVKPIIKKTGRFFKKILPL